MPMRSKIALSLLALLILVPASPASARSSIRIGVADQSPSMFDNPHFQELNIKRTRYFVPADVMQDAEELDTATALADAQPAPPLLRPGRRHAGRRGARQGRGVRERRAQQRRLAVPAHLHGRPAR